MTSLRTMWGCNLAQLQQISPKYSNYFLENVQPFLEKKEIQEEEGIYRLTKTGKLLADHVAASLFWVGE